MTKSTVAVSTKMAGGRHLLILMFLAALQVTGAYSQTENTGLSVFGYFQTTFDHNNAITGRSTDPSNRFYLQQLNLMLSNHFTPSLNAFVNFEVTNNYSSSKNFGSFSLEEAWVKYRASQNLNIKAGMLVPAFNHLNEIKNRTPLLPYIFRPFVYESSVADIFPVGELVPQQAFLQVYGSIPVSDLKFEYAAYAGNGDPEYTNSTDGNFQSRGVDTTSFKMVGTRLGIQGDHFRSGVSLTSDKDDGTPLGLGPVHRYRVGADLSFEIAGLSAEFEFITVAHAMTPEQKATLSAVASMVPEVGTNLDKGFYYGLLNYDVTEEFFGYAGYNYCRDRSATALNYGFVAYTAGGGFRPHSNVVVKTQYILFKLLDNPLFSFREDHYMVAVSVFF